MTGRYFNNTALARHSISTVNPSLADVWSSTKGRPLWMPPKATAEDLDYRSCSKTKSKRCPSAWTAHDGFLHIHTHKCSYMLFWGQPPAKGIIISCRSHRKLAFHNFLFSFFVLLKQKNTNQMSLAIHAVILLIKTEHAGLLLVCYDTKTDILVLLPSSQSHTGRHHTRFLPGWNILALLFIHSERKCYRVHLLLTFHYHIKLHSYFVWFQSCNQCTIHTHTHLCSVITSSIHEGYNQTHSRPLLQALFHTLVPTHLYFPHHYNSCAHSYLASTKFMFTSKEERVDKGNRVKASQCSS